MLCVILLLSSVLAAVYYTKTINHQATIVTNGKIQSYEDPSCTLALDNEDWGDFNASLGDDNKTLNVYVRNEGNVKVNITWKASGFTSYNGTGIQYETSSWKLYLVKVDGTEVKLRPENDTAPDKVPLLKGEVAHLRFYLIAIKDSLAGAFTFQTYFKSQDN